MPSLPSLPAPAATSTPITVFDRLIDNVIFDLGDVLFTWSANTNTSISSKLLFSILRSSTWFEYEKGNLTEEQVYGLSAAQFSLDASDVRAAFRAARDTLQSNASVVALLRDLKANHNVRLFAMSNISAPDWEVLLHKDRPEVWALFEHVFISAAACERKPNVGFFRHVLEATGIDPQRTAFVDDKAENVLAARCLGIKGIVFTSFDEVARELRALLRNPVVDGEQYLRQHAKELKTVTSTGVVLEENFTQLLILELTGDPSLVDYVKYSRRSNFFKSEGVLTTPDYPDDANTSSLACVVSDHFSEEAKHEIMDDILTLKNKDGIIQMYFDATRPRIDPIVCINVLVFFHSHGRAGDVQESFDWVYQVLKNRAYTNGTLYYLGPDIFLYFLSRLLSTSIYARQYLGPLFAKRVAERFGTEGDALALAMRVYAAAVADLCDRTDYERLKKMQNADGSWPMGWLYRYGLSKIFIGNQGFTTALAVSAIRNYEAVALRLRSID